MLKERGSRYTKKAVLELSSLDAQTENSLHQHNSDHAKIVNFTYKNSQTLSYTLHDIYKCIMTSYYIHAYYLHNNS